MLEACNYSFKACDLKEAEGCLNAGICLSEGIGGMPKDVKESLTYYNKACNGKNSYACLRLFQIYFEGKEGIARNAHTAFEYTRKACDQDDVLGCMNASIMLRKGDGIPKNDALSEEYREKAENIRKQVSSNKEQIPIVFGQQHK